MKNNFFKTQIVLTAAFFCALLPLKAEAAITNVLGNAQFENALGDTNGVGNWNSEANRGISQRTAVDAPEGKAYMRLSEPDTVAGGFIGVFTFQLVEGVKPGDVVTFSALSRVVATNGVEALQIRIEYRNAGGFISDDTLSIPSVVSTNFERRIVSGIAPAGTDRVSFVFRIQPSAAAGTFIGDVDDVIGTINSVPILVSAAPSTASMKTGQIKMIALNVQNLSEITQPMELVIEPQKGINIKADQAVFDGRPTSNREGSVIFAFTLNPGENAVFGLPVVLTSAAVPGKAYDLTIFARTANGTRTDPVHVVIYPQLDPVFDEGTIIGKVFNDLNKNGVQDDCVITGAEEKCSGGEQGVPFVHLATEEGIRIITDEHGRYHIPAVKPGRHIVKVDGHSLPEGTQFITEESFLVKTTPGIMNKANFAVWIPPSSIPEAFQKDLTVSVTQGLDTAKPALDVFMEPQQLKVGVGVLERDPSFKFRLNYPEMVKSWYLEIRDEMGREIWTGFGVGAPPDEVSWAGKGENGLIVKPGVYSYQFKVQDAQGNQDWTPLNFFYVVSKTDYDGDNKRPEIPAIGDFNIFKDGKRSIPLVAKPTVRVQGKTRPGHEVRINSQPVKTDSEGYFNTEVYTTAGEKLIQVSATSSDGETVTFEKKIKIKDSTFFMVALGEEQMGVNFQDGAVETVGDEDTYKDGFYEEGRASYYLKGKIKGKFMVKSHYDTDDKRSQLFTNLDPDEYYPIYGDASERDYEAQDTQSRFYFVIERERQFLKYGSFKTGFTDTELATYSRTLSGVQGSFETLKSTVYGDPKSGIKAFGAHSSQRADHNEFAATGGSLYYTRFRNLIQGGEKLRVEVRDKIQDLVLHSYDLIEGQDYEIDYAQGRILLSKPLSSIAGSDTLASTDILNGSPVYLIADYEYDAGPDTFENDNGGLRGYTHVGEHIRIGATGVKERRQNEDYDVRGIDAQVKVGRNTKVSMEYAESKFEQVSEAISYNGGLSFANAPMLQAATGKPDKAFLLKAESKPVKNLETSGYIQGVHPRFSTDRIRSQAGTAKYGFAGKYKFTDNLYARYRFDNNEAARQLLPLDGTDTFIPFESYKNHTGQLVYNDGTWLAETEYRRQFLDLPAVENLLPTLLSTNMHKNVISEKVGRRFNDRVLPYVKVQTTVDGRPNHQFGGGVRYDLTNQLAAYIEQMFGNLGDSTNFGVEKYQGTTRSYANLGMVDRGVGLPLLATTIGNSFAVTEKSRIYSERQYAGYQSTDGYATDAMGYQNEINENWSFDLKGERRHLRTIKTTDDDVFTVDLDDAARASVARSSNFNTVAGGVAYIDGKKMKARSALEYRRDQDAPRLSQWVVRNAVERKITQDVGLLAKMDYGRSVFIDPHDTTADFMEMSTGIAYRPVKNDKLNILTRYTYLKDIANDVQFYNGLYGGTEVDERAHIASIDFAYELHRYLGWVEKVAYKRSQLNSNLSDQIALHTFLWVNRFNFHVTRKWDVALEYRTLWQFDAARTLKQGALAEIDRELYDYVRLGVGYNFTDFDDDLRKSNNIDSHGPFVRLTGKF